SVAGIDDLARMLDALGPAHLRNVHQSFNAALQLDEGAVISHARHASIHAAADRETLFDAGPRIRKQLLVTERHAFTLAIELEHLDLNRVPDFEQLVRVLKPTPRHVSHVQQAVDAAEIEEGAVVSQVLDLALDDDVLFDLLERLVLAAGVLL